MLRSMTGYGEATVDASDFVFSIEIKCVNNKFLKITSRVPEEISFLQPEIEETIRRHVRRGSIGVTVRFELKSDTALYRINEALLRKYYQTFQSLNEEIGGGERLQLRDLLPLPGVVESGTSALVGHDHVGPKAQEATRQALERMIAMRVKEGAALLEEFHTRSGLIRGLLDRVKEVQPTAVAEHHARLKDRVNVLIDDRSRSVSQDDLIREIALLAERSDINEEISRMESHVVQFDDTLQSEEAVGRTLEFLTQEMFRECNTMGSKAVNGELHRLIIEMKAEVIRLREQALNVE